jgi:anti-repressor protein
MNELQVFTYEGNEVRTVQRDGAPWWVAKDVCAVLGYSGFNVRLVEKIPEEWKGMNPIHTLGGTQEMVVLSEQGLYFFLARSDKSAALPFQKWIAGEVLPAIRKHGAYVTPAKLEELISNPDAWIQMLTVLKETRAANAQLQLQAETNQPKVVFADAVSVSDGAILIGELAKILRGNRVQIGQNRLFEQLRQDGFLIRRQGSDYNAPTQRSMELGLFKIKETAVAHSDGHVTISKTTKVTGKGQQYFVNLFLGKGECA